MRRRMRSKSNSMYSISMATAIDTFRFSIVCRRSRLPFGERHRTNHNLKCVQFPAMMWWSNNNLITKLHWVSGMKIKFYFLGAHSVKSHHVSVRWPLLFVDIIFFPFSCLPSWVVGVVRKPKILFSFSINTHTHGHDRFLRAPSILRSVSWFISYFFFSSCRQSERYQTVCRACPIRNCISLILLNVLLFRCLFSYILFSLTSLYGFISTCAVLYLVEMAFLDAKIHINKNKSHAEV